HLNPQDRPPSSPTAIATPGTVFAVMQPAQRAIAQRFCAMAHDCVRGTAPFRTRLDNNGQTSAKTPNCYATFDPQRTKISLSGIVQATPEFIWAMTNSTNGILGGCHDERPASRRIRSGVRF